MIAAEKTELELVKAKTHAEVAMAEMKLNYLEAASKKVQNTFQSGSNPTFVNVNFNFNNWRQDPLTPSSSPHGSAGVPTFGEVSPDSSSPFTNGPYQATIGGPTSSTGSAFPQAMTVFGSQPYLPAHGQAGFGQGTVPALPLHNDNAPDMLDLQLFLPLADMEPSASTLVAALPSTTPTAAPAVSRGLLSGAPFPLAMRPKTAARP